MKMIPTFSSSSRNAWASSDVHPGLSSSRKARGSSVFVAFLFAWIAFSLTSTASAASLEPLNDSQLANITGREGVALDFDYGLNAYKDTIGTYTDANGTHKVRISSDGYIMNGTVVTTEKFSNKSNATILHHRGDPLPINMIDPTANVTSPNTYFVNYNPAKGGCQRVVAGSNPCSLAVATNNRPGMWLILKDMSAVLRMNNLWLDGGTVTEDGSGNVTLTLAGRDPDVTHTLSNNHPDPTRFFDAAGNCLLAVNAATNGCFVDDLPVLTMQYDPNNLSYRGVDADVTWHLYIGRIAMQGNNNPSFNTKPAFMTDQAGSFMSYQVSDFNQNEAKIHYGGRVMMFGF